MWHIWKNPFGKMPSSSRSASCLTADKKVAVVKKNSEGFVVQKSDILCSNTSRYLIQDFTGEGCFGKVAKCVNLITSQDVALKILKTEDSVVTKREIKMLEVVSVLDPVKKNVVQFFEKFEHEGHTCLAFEMLDGSLFQLFKDRHWKPLSLSEIRPIAQQLLTAFDALKGIGVVHSDLKPDNIMLANHLHVPFRVKLIDFGVSFTTSEVTHGLVIQPLGYRAPEVTLGLPISEAIDMWGLGCVLAFLYLADNLFATHCEYQTMRGIVEILGQPADHLLCAGNNTHKYFKLNQHWDNPKWWLKTPREYQLDTGVAPKRWERSFKSLDDLITLHPEMQESIQLEDQTAFMSLLKGLLHTDPEKRITPERALKHPFITMAHLVDEMDTSLYVDNSFDKMLVCPMDDLEEELPPDGEDDEETKGEAPSVPPRTNGAGSATLRSCDITNMPRSNDGAAAAGVVDTTGSAEEESGAASPAEETSAADGSPDEGPPVKDKKSRLKRIRKFFGRAIRTLFAQ
ncbi:homeodomain-interacting protein kinase 2-like [Siniperca chuatsi]|uniref:homeodomain-interacting protein kinase 2-like n=1 Tax=Siniperca chuatsi TaxID=119488 RepID=UPI001CE0E47D|nr:homeodomain-interacting protein kinase 2-like [Siniperca chuatsi]